MYRVTLINLAPDARTAAPALVPVEREVADDAGMRGLLEAFLQLDPVENATADPEMRVRVRHESYVVRLGQKRLILLDALQRDLPAQILGSAEVMAELDGTAGRERTRLQLERVAASAPPAAAPPVPAGSAEAIHGPRLLALAGLVALQALGLGWLWWPEREDRGAEVERVASAEAEALLGRQAGVYLTGDRPGEHGIALTTGGELRLFELQAVNAPRVVRLDAQLVRRDGALAFATGQPGGAILVVDRDTLVYGGETYRRIP